MSIKNCSFYLQNADLLLCFNHKPLLKITTGHTINEKCITWAVGLYNDLNSKDHQQEFSSPFEPLPPSEQVTHIPIEVNEIVTEPDIEKLAKMYDALGNLPTVQMDKVDLSLENASPMEIPHLEQKLIFLPEFTLDKIVKVQKKDKFYNNILQHIHCSKNENYFLDAMGILHKKVIDFNSIFQQWLYHKSSLHIYCTLQMTP